MCLGVPGKIVDIYEANTLRMCKIDFGGAVVEACLEAIPEARVGDYTIVHAGFALNLLSEEEAEQTLAALRELGGLVDELGLEAEESRDADL
jgi:hydrogenase expression/formation protein HypC